MGHESSVFFLELSTFVDASKMYWYGVHRCVTVNSVPVKTVVAWYQRHMVELVYNNIIISWYTSCQGSSWSSSDLCFMITLCINYLYVYWLKLWVLFVCYYNIVIFDEKMKLTGYDLHIRTQKIIPSFFTMACWCHPKKGIKKSTIFTRTTQHWNALTLQPATG